jgi:glutathione S-transferase kappa 1
MPKITLYYDVVSPYSWFGFIALQRCKKIWNCKTVFEPIFLGAIMNASANKPPATNPSKAKHLAKDIQLNNLLFKPSLPLLKFPTIFPANSLACQRILTLIKLKGELQVMEKVSIKFWESYWALDGDISQEELIRSCLKDFFSPAQVDQIWADKDDVKVKEELKNTTAQVISYGAFGAPWIHVERDDGVVADFFGSDRFESIAHFLGFPYQGVNPPTLAKV